jgi:glutamate-1-semialdehyde 2,1-aminomutase
VAVVEPGPAPPAPLDTAELVEVVAPGVPVDPAEDPLDVPVVAPLVATGDFVSSEHAALVAAIATKTTTMPDQLALASFAFATSSSVRIIRLAPTVEPPEYQVYRTGIHRGSVTVQRGLVRRDGPCWSAMADQKSASLYERAEKAIVGGVNSPVRAFRAVGGGPVFIARASGAMLYGADGTAYIDYVGSWGPAILGHAHPDVVKAVQRVAEHGLSFGAPTELEVRFAEKVKELYPSIAKVRCVSSGTEATMSAIRVARGFTKRDLIVKFEGCYHGHADYLLVKAGSGAATFGVPDSAGVPARFAEATLTLPYNDEAALEALFEKRGTEIAAAIVEPVVGNMGCVPPKPGFLKAIVEWCRRSGAISIFDEVMTGCRLAPGGAQQLFGLRPDLTCLGKIVGGGLPLAAYGGREDVMNVVSPLGPVYQAGTLSGNPVAVTAGLATLERLTPDLYERIERTSARLEEGLARAISDRRLAARVQRVGSMLTVFFRRDPVSSWADAAQCDTKKFASWHKELLARGVYWPPSQFEAAFVGAAHGPDEIARTLDAAASAFEAAA